MDNDFVLNQNMSVERGRYQRARETLGYCFDIFNQEEHVLVDYLLDQPNHIVVKSGDSFFCVERTNLVTMFNSTTSRYYYYDVEGNQYLELPFNRIYVTYEGAKILVEELEYQIFELVDEGIVTDLSNWQEDDTNQQVFTPKNIRGVAAYDLDAYIETLT